MATKTPNYTPEQTAALVARAPINKALAQTIADETGRSLRSIIAKATKEGVYVPQGKVTKSGAPVVSKSDLVSMIAEVVDGNLEGLDKAPKAALHALRNALGA